MSVQRAEADLQRVRTEISRLQTQLRNAEERAIKLAHYIEMARRYEGVSSQSVTTNLRITTDDNDLVPNRTGIPPRNVSETIEILKKSGRPMKTSELVDALQQRGIEIGGEKPITNLSGSLSRWKSLLIPDRTRGWSLREWRTTYGSSNIEDGTDIDYHNNIEQTGDSQSLSAAESHSSTPDDDEL